MDEKFLISLIAAGSALIGSLIPQVFTFFNNRSQRAFEKEKNVKGRQLEVYENLLINLQSVINKGDERFPELQKSIIQISLLGDSATASTVEKYYRELVRRGAELQEDDHAMHQKNIINSMRSQIELEPLETFEIVRFAPNINRE